MMKKKYSKLAKILERSAIVFEGTHIEIFSHEGKHSELFDVLVEIQKEINALTGISE